MPACIEPSSAPRHRWLWPLLLGVTLVCASSTNPAAPPGTFVGFDKLAHFGLFGLLATLLLRVPAIWARPGWRGWIAVLAVSAFGGTDEWHQSFTPGRSVEWADWIADTGGAALAVVLYLWWPAYRRLLERPLRRRRVPIAAGAVAAQAAPAAAEH